MELKVLVACEFSGIVREAFRRRGHDAWSCDLLPSEDGSKYHIQGNIVNHNIIKAGWDIGIFFPDCTFLTVSGARHMSVPWRTEALKWSVAFIRILWAFPIDKISIENPIGCLSTLWQKPTQIIQPWQFGHGETKATCLWLKNLPKLKPTNIVPGRENKIHKMPPSKDRGKLRSITFQGIADAMAEQWG